MNTTSLKEALAPLSARMGKAVREHEILRISAILDGKGGVNTAEDARKQVLIWAQNRCGGRLPPEAWKFEGFEYFSGGRNSIGVRIHGTNSDLWSIRADDPDKNIAGRIWTTEVVVGKLEDNRPRFSVRLLVSTSEEELDIELHTPGFVQQVSETCGLLCGEYILSHKPWMIGSDQEAEQLVDMLVDPLRKLPVFVLTVPENSTDPNLPLLDSVSISRAVLGIAHIVVLPANFTWIATDRLGKQRSVFGGAIRVYLPGFNEDSYPYSHKLVLAERILDTDGPSQFSLWIRALAGSESVRRLRLGDEVLAFSTIRDAALSIKQEKLEYSGASEGEKLEAARERIKALENQIEDNEVTLEYFASEHGKAEERAETAEDQLRASRFRIQQLLNQINARGEAVDANIELPPSWGEFTDWCDTNLAGRVVLSSKARRGVRSPAYRDVAQVARCLLWLANDCRDRRMSGGGTIREEVIEEGIRNAYCGGDKYNTGWQGQKYTVDWHIKTGGNTRDPALCLRIYHFWDEISQQIIIDDMPAHRRTGAS